MTYWSLDVYSDEELGRLIRAAVRGREHEAGRLRESRSALAALFRLAGFGELSDVITLVTYVWKRVQDLLRIVLGQ